MVNVEDFRPIAIKALTWQAVTAGDLAARSSLLPPAAQQRLDIEKLQAAEYPDIAALHCFASLDNRSVGYLRVNADGELAHLGTDKTRHEDILEALLRFAVMEAPRRNLSRLWTATDHDAPAILQALGFEKDGKQLHLFLPPDRSRHSSGSELVRLEHIGDFRSFSLQLVSHTQRQLAIFSEDLEAWLYDHDDFTNAVMALAQRSRYSEIRIIVRDTRAVLEHGHRLLRASQRASDKIHIRKLANVSGKQPCYLLSDDGGMLLRPDPEIVLGIGYSDYRGRVKPLREQFNTLWQSAYVDADLRRLTL